jgi:hypothetical protein
VCPVNHELTRINVAAVDCHDLPDALAKKFRCELACAATNIHNTLRRYDRQDFPNDYGRGLYSERIYAVKFFVINGPGRSGQSVAPGSIIFSLSLTCKTAAIPANNRAGRGSMASKSAAMPQLLPRKRSGFGQISRLIHAAHAIRAETG